MFTISPIRSNRWRVSYALNRDFVLLWQGQLVSQLGNQAFSLAMLYWLMEMTGSASLMGSLMMVSLLPGVLLGPIGGAIADRHSRLRIIVVSDLLRGLLVLGLAALLFLRAAPWTVLMGLFTVALLAGLINAVFQPAVAAVIPDVVAPNRVAGANALNQLSVQGSAMLGQAAGGLMYSLIGPAYLFLADGLTYLFSAMSEAFIRIPPRPESRRVKPREAFHAYARDALDGLHYVWSRSGSRGFLLATGAVNFLAMPVIILLPFYVSDSLGRGAAWYGFLLAALGAGSLVGYLLLGIRRIAADRRPPVVVGAFGLVGGLFMAIGVVRIPVAALGLFFIVGLCTGVINVLVLTLFQVTTPTAMRGRVMSLVITLSGAMTPLGMVLGGVLGDLTEKNILLIYVACGALVLVVVASCLARPSCRAFLAEEIDARAQPVSGHEPQPQP